MHPYSSLSSLSSNATIAGPSSSQTLPPHTDDQNRADWPSFTIQHYSGSSSPPPNWFYYPPHIVEDFQSLTQEELDKRDELGLNSLPESRRYFRLQKLSSWRAVLRAAILGSPKLELVLQEIKDVLHARFPDLSITLCSDNVIRHTLSFCKDFDVKDRHWTVGSYGSTEQKENTNKSGNRMGRPPKVYQDVPWAPNTLIFPISENPCNGGTSIDTSQSCDDRLPSCKDLLKIAEVIRYPDRQFEVNRIPYHDVFGCQGLTDMINQQRTTDLKTLARRWEGG